MRALIPESAVRSSTAIMALAAALLTAVSLLSQLQDLLVSLTGTYTGEKVVFTHILNRGGRGVASPLDKLGETSRPPRAAEPFRTYRTSSRPLEISGRCPTAPAGVV
jgi:hypothetical protein